MLREALESRLSAGSALPRPLAALCDLADEIGNPVVCDFRISSEGSEDLYWWSGKTEAIYTHFFIFGNDELHSLYGYWIAETKTLEEAPIVYLDGEGVGSSVIAASTEDFLALLGLGKHSVGRVESWDDAQRSCRNLDHFRRWLTEEMDIPIPADPRAIVARARSSHPPLDEWLAKRRSTE